MSPGRRLSAGVGAALSVALLGLVVFLLLVVGRASSRIDALNTSEQSRDRAISALASGDSQLRAQVRSLGGTPNVPPPQVVVSAIPGTVGQQGPAPSDAQVAAAVAAYLVLHPAPGVSSAQVSTAVTAYLIASPAPSGPAGPGPSEQQVAAAVASYMAANPAPSGPAGKDGSNGADGPPPAGWTFEANGVTYDCVPDGGTPAPHYTCPPSASPSPTDSTAPSAIPSASSASPAPSGSAAAAPATAPAAFAVLPGAPGAPNPDAGRWLALLFGVPFYRRGL